MLPHNRYHFLQAELPTTLLLLQELLLLPARLFVSVWQPLHSRALAAHSTRPSLLSVVAATAPAAGTPAHLTASTRLSLCPLLPLPRSTAKSSISPQHCQLPTSSKRQCETTAGGTHRLGWLLLLLLLAGVAP